LPDKIFINYRPGDDPAGRPFDHPHDSFATEQLLIDVDIPPRIDFVCVPNDRVAECDCAEGFPLAVVTAETSYYPYMKAWLAMRRQQLPSHGLASET
jgi:hypothetical protein